MMGDTDGTSLLDLFTRAINLANNVSVHAVEYLAASSTQPTTFRPLAIKFLELYQILWPIRTGLLEKSQSQDIIPQEVSQQLAKKTFQTIDDLCSIDLLLNKLLIHAKKKGFTKFVKGLNLMSVESELVTLNLSIAKDCDDLRMGSLAFKWVLGDAGCRDINESAYTGLAKALRVQTGSKASSINVKIQPMNDLPGRTSSLPKPKTSTPRLDNAAAPPLRQAQSSRDHPLGALVRADSLRKAHPPSAPAKHDNGHLPSHVHLDAPSIPNSPLSPSMFALPGPDQTPSRSTDYSTARRSSRSLQHIASSHSSYQRSNESLIQLGEPLRSSSPDRDLVSPAKFKSHTAAQPSWTAERVAEVGLPMVKAALVTAVQERDHNSLEQLLESGLPAEAVKEINLLSQAALNRDIQTVRLLLRFGADPNRVDSDTISPLVAATEVSSVEMAELLLKHGADPNLGAGPDGQSPVALCARMGHFTLLHIYLEHGGDPNTMTSDGDTVFMKTIYQTTAAETVIYMLRWGANVNSKTKQGKTPLFEAISVRRIDLIMLLLDHGANPNLAGPKHPLWAAVHNPAALQLLINRGAKCTMTPGILELATSINNMESVNILLKAGVSPNIKKDGVYTPLCSAIRDDRAETVTLLLAHGADPNIPASEYPAFKCITHGRLHFLPELVSAGVNLNEPKGILETAVSHNSIDAITFLLNHDVDVNARNSQGHTALTTAIRENREQVIAILLSHGANPTTRGEDWPLCMAVKRPRILKRLLAATAKPGSSAPGLIELAVKANQLESIKLLLDAGVSVEDKTGGVFSPLTTAIRENKQEIVRYLLDEAGADINAPGEHLPIIKAIRNNAGPHDTEMISILLKRGADINLVYRGWNAVMQAIEKGEPAILRLLIEQGNGIDLRVIDPESGKEVMEFVRERGWQEGADMLIEHQTQVRMIAGLAA